MGSAESLSGLERCGRIPWWAVEWKPRKLKPEKMIEAGVRAGLLYGSPAGNREQGTGIRTDYGNVAGEEVYGLGSDPGIDSKQYDQHAEVVHLACIADAVTTAIRKPGSPAWTPAPLLDNWQSGCYLSPDGAHLRRIVYVTSWSFDRHYAMCRTWETLGEVCHHKLPMQMVVVHLGKHLDGKFYSFWTKGLRHPANKKLRFRKRNNVDEPFKASWIEVWRENYDDISTQEWLQGMLDDGVLQDCCFTIEIEVPKEEQRQRIADLAQRKLEIVRNTRELPMQNLSTCDWPTACVHRQHCHAQQEPSEAYGFVRISG